MEKERAEYLYEKYQQQSLTAEERLEWESFGLDPEHDSSFQALVDGLWEQPALVEPMKRSRAEEIADHVMAQPQPRLRLLWPGRIRVAAGIAAAVATIVFGVWFFNAPRHDGRNEANSDLTNFKNDIAPGRNTATLILANGKTIPLDTNRSSMVVTDSVKTNTMLTASTPKGGTYAFILPDGTKVWLNADSKISFPSQFSGQTRKVVLLGEGYFEVAKQIRPSLQNAARNDERVPFIVESAGQQVKVLGTHFNINSYPDEGPAETTLLEGSVEVNGTTLKPNQQAILTPDHSIQVKEADLEEAMAWKNGYFRFNDEGIASVMRKLARWYNISITYEGQMTREKFTGTVNRNKNISEALLMLEQTKGVHFRIEGRRVIVIR